MPPSAADFSCLRPWQAIPLWAAWWRSLPGEAGFEVMLQAAPGVQRLPAGLNFPGGLHLRWTSETLSLAPGAAGWRNPRGEIGSDWVAWENALIDAPEDARKGVVPFAAPVQWALASAACVTVQEGGIDALLLELQAVSPLGQALAKPARYLMGERDVAGRPSLQRRRSDPRVGDGRCWQTLLAASPLPAAEASPGLDALRAAWGPLFPRPESALPPLDLRLDGASYVAAWQARSADALLPYWQRLAWVYGLALAMPDADDAGWLAVEIEDWPADMAAQQATLQALLADGPLRAAMRRTQAGLDTLAGDGDAGQAQQAALYEAERTAARPLAEIPLYAGYLRVSCQQLLCLPHADDRALADPQLPYAPEAVDTDTVARLARRIARLFNAPPVQAPADLALVPSRAAPIVWPTSLAGLCERRASHGMADRWCDDQGRIRPPSDLPAWRFDGFCGRLRVTLENGENWVLTVLAPGHFVSTLSSLTAGHA